MMWIAWSPQVSSCCPDRRAWTALPKSRPSALAGAAVPCGRGSPGPPLGARPYFTLPLSWRTVTNGPPCPTGLSVWGGGRRFPSAALTLVAHPISELNSLSESPEGFKYRRVNAWEPSQCGEGPPA